MPAPITPHGPQGADYPVGQEHLPAWADAFERMSAALGGPKDLIAGAAHHLPAAPITRAVYPAGAGTIGAVDTRGVGLAVIALGGGRTRADQAIDHSVGFSGIAAIGEQAAKDKPLAMVHARNEAESESAAAALRACFTIGPEAPPVHPVVLSRIGEGGC